METDWVLKGTKKAKKHRNPMCVCRIQRALLFWPVGSIGPKPINGPHTKQEQRTLSGKKGIVVKKGTINFGTDRSFLSHRGTTRSHLLKIRTY